MRFVITVIIDAIAIWVTAQIFDGITVIANSPDLTDQVVVLAIIGLVFALVNAIIKPIVKVLALPLYILTLGLFTLVVNAAMLMLTSYLTGIFNFGLQVDGFWTAVWGSLVISIVTFILSLVFRRSDRRR